MKAYGTRWTKNGQYNWATYEPRGKIEAMPYSPTAHTRYIVWWYPGKPLLGCCLDDKSLDDTLSLLETLPREGSFVIMQEPIPNGAWWIKLNKRPVGPYSFEQILNDFLLAR